MKTEQFRALEYITTQEQLDAYVGEHTATLRARIAELEAENKWIKAMGVSDDQAKQLGQALDRVAELGAWVSEMDRLLEKESERRKELEAEIKRMYRENERMEREWMDAKSGANEP